MNPTAAPMLDWSLMLVSLIRLGPHLLLGHLCSGVPQSSWFPPKYEASNFCSEAGIRPLNWLCSTLRTFRFVRFAILSGISPENLLKERSRDDRYDSCQEMSGGIGPEKIVTWQVQHVQACAMLKTLRKMGLQALGCRDAKHKPCSRLGVSIPRQEIGICNHRWYCRQNPMRTWGCLWNQSLILAQTTGTGYQVENRNKTMSS